MIGGGGGAGLYSVGIARRLRLQQRDHPAGSEPSRPAGALLSDLGRTYAATASTSTDAWDPTGRPRSCPTCAGKPRPSSRRPGAMPSRPRSAYSIEGRYPHQVWEVEVPLRDGSTRLRSGGRRTSPAPSTRLTSNCSQSATRRRRSRSSHGAPTRGAHFAKWTSERARSTASRHSPLDAEAGLLPTDGSCRRDSPSARVAQRRRPPSRARRSSSRPRQPSSSIRTRRARPRPSGSVVIYP